MYLDFFGKHISIFFYNELSWKFNLTLWWLTWHRVSKLTCHHVSKTALKTI
jgi:hypothetical protein